MEDEGEHAAFVQAWMDRVAKGLPADQLIQTFERGFAALWGRANQTLGDVTLNAILDRVFVNAAEQFPFLAALETSTTGVRCERLAERAHSFNDDQLAEGLRFMLAEFLTVLGNLTAEILTPALHSELAKVGPARGGQETDP